jgi:hypothetical protein
MSAEFLYLIQVHFTLPLYVQSIPAPVVALHHLDR